MSLSRGAKPGTLMLVVGPSGAGKDTLIAVAQDVVRDSQMIVFPRRIVTREDSVAESHDSLSPVEFDDALRRGAFAFWWEAHGLKYGIPAAVDGDIGGGKTVVCNVSRMLVPRLRRQYVSCKVVLVDAPREIRAARIHARGRATDGEPEKRLDRIAPNHDSLAPDLVINNVGDPRDGGRILANALLGITRDMAFSA